MSTALALGIAALVLPVILIVGVPRRWTGRAMLLWLVSPVIAYFAVILWETATRPGTPIDLADVMLGLSLISAIFILPWLALSAAAFVIGLVLRRILRGPGDSAPLPVPVLAPPPPPEAATAIAHPAPPKAAGMGRAFSRPVVADHADVIDWRCVHIGFDNDDLRIDKRDVWKEKWRPTGQPPVRLPHPAYPAQLHDFDIYECGNTASPLRFAAGELSNSVWGFYVPHEHPVQSRGVSLDGTLRFEHRLGDFISPGRYDSLTTTIALIDVESGEILADASRWQSSNIQGDTDGCLLLKVSENGYDALFRVDPATRSFVNRDDPTVRRPIAQLVDAMEEARAEAKGARAYRHISPDGTIRVDQQSSEWGNSRWVHSPRVIETATGRIILDLWGFDWDASVSFPEAGQVALGLRRYHFGGGMRVILDLPRETFHIDEEYGVEAGQSSGALSDVLAALEQSSRRSAAAVAAQFGKEDNFLAFDHRPNPWAAWRSGLLILLGTACALSAIAWLAYSHEQANKKPFVPTPVPHPVLRNIPRPDVSPGRYDPAPSNIH